MVQEAEPEGAWSSSSHCLCTQGAEDRKCRYSAGVLLCLFTLSLASQSEDGDTHIQEKTSQLSVLRNIITDKRRSVSFG